MESSESLDEFNIQICYAGQQVVNEEGTFTIDDDYINKLIHSYNKFLDLLIFKSTDNIKYDIYFNCNDTDHGLKTFNLNYIERDGSNNQFKIIISNDEYKVSLCFYNSHIKNLIGKSCSEKHCIMKDSGLEINNIFNFFIIDNTIINSKTIINSTNDLKDYLEKNGKPLSFVTYIDILHLIYALKLLLESKKSLPYKNERKYIEESINSFIVMLSLFLPDKSVIKNDLNECLLFNIISSNIYDEIVIIPDDKHKESIEMKDISTTTRK